MKLAYYGLIFSVMLLWAGWATDKINVFALISVTAFTISILIDVLIPDEKP